MSLFATPCDIGLKLPVLLWIKNLMVQMVQCSCNVFLTSAKRNAIFSDLQLMFFSDAKGVPQNVISETSVVPPVTSNISLTYVTQNLSLTNVKMDVSSLS